MLLSDRELAIPSHPKHLEKLFETMKINKGLKPSKCQSISFWMNLMRPMSWPQTRPKSIGLALAFFFTLPATSSSGNMQSEVLHKRCQNH